MAAQTLLSRSSLATLAAAAALSAGGASLRAVDVTVTSITPAAGPPGGGDGITITGTGFTADAGVFLGSTRATDVVVIDDQTIVARTPAAEGPGTVTVTINTDGGIGSLSDGYKYISPFAFTDDPLTAGATVVKGQHVNELRDAIDLVRFAASESTGGWTATLVPGTTVIAAQHMLELRERLEEALGAMHFPSQAYSDPSIPPATVTVKAAHVDEIRARLRHTGPYCTYDLSQQSFGADANGDGVNVTVTTGASCLWSVAADDMWVTTGDGGSHTGSGSLGLTVSMNLTGSTRTTKVWIGDQRFVVTQASAEE